MAVQTFLATPATGICLTDSGGYSTMLVFFILPCVILLLLKFLHQYISYRREMNLLPGSQDLHPILGDLHNYRGQGEEGMALDFEIAKKYKYFHRFWIGPFLTLRVYHPESIRAVVNSKPDKPRNTSRVASTIYDMVVPWLGESLLLTNGPRWHRNRRLLTPSFHFDILKNYVEVMNSCGDVCVSQLKIVSEKKMSFDIQPFITRMTRDVILRCAFSYPSNCQTDTSSNEYLDVIDELEHLWIQRIFNPILKLDLVYRFTSQGRTFHNLCASAHREAEKIIKKRLGEIDSNENNSIAGKKRKACDFLDTLLTARDEDGNGLSQQEIRDEVDTFLFAGHDTTSSGVMWTLVCLAEHQQHQDLVHAEVKDVLGDRGHGVHGGHVTWEDLSRLRYTEQVVKEALRLHSPVPGVDRVSTQEIELDGYKIPAGTTLSIHLWALHHNPHVWEEPHQFHPERFHPDNMTSMDPFQFIPFFAGSRNCIGQKFAMNEMKVAVTKIIRNFRLTSDTERPARRFMGVTMKAEHGAYVFATPR